MLPTNDKERKALPILTFLTKYFPDAILEMVRVSVAGNVQHNPKLAPTDIKWSREKSTDQMNTAFRHMWDHATGTKRDTDGQYHLAKAAWRILAELQLTIEAGPAKEGAMAELEGVWPAAAKPLFGLNGEVNAADASAAAYDAPLLAECQHGYRFCRVCQFP